MRALKVGIAGAGRGRGFLQGLKRLGPAVTLNAVYDPDEGARSAFASAHSVAYAVGTYAELLPLCDLVVLSSPQHHHAPQAVAALEAGVHVLSEVPAAVSLEQASQLVAAARSSSAVYAMAENYCYIKTNLIVREMVRAGLFGDLYFGEGEYLHEMRDFHTGDNGHPTWRYHWQVGRNGFTYPTHSLGPVLQWFNDRIESVSCVGTGRHTDPEHAIDDSVTMLARTSRGALLRARLDLLSNRPHLMDYYSLQGTLGAFEAPRTPGATHMVYLHDVSPSNTWEPLERYEARFLPEWYTAGGREVGHWGADLWPINDIVQSINSDTPPTVGLYEALNMTLPGIMSESSIKTHGSWVSVPDPHFLTAGIGVDPGREAPLT